VYAYTAELHSKNQNNQDGVRYTVDAFAKQMKATTALKGTILQKTDQNFTLLSYSMVNMNLKVLKMSSF